jgi:anti-sigma factor ChrR (cupin superfamily)
MTGLPQAGSVKVDAADTPPGVEIRSLIDDPRGYRTMVMTVAPSPLGELHSHDEIEQIYVLEGDFFDDEASYGPGDFVLRMPGAMHRAGSKQGCTMLITYTPFVEVHS